MDFRKFSLACVALILALVGAVGTFNRIIDPYGYFRDVEIAGINADKTRAPGNERLVKPPLMRRLAPEAMIVGSSFAEVGLPPLHPGFTRNGALTSFNFGTPAAKWNEVYCLAMFALRQPQLKRLVVGVSGIDSVPCPDDNEIARADYGKLLFSRIALDASRETLRSQGRPSAMTREGMWTYGRYDEHLQSDDQVVGNFALEFAGALCPAALDEPRAMDPARVDRTLPSPGTAVGLRNLIRLALEKKVELVLLFYPTHVLFNEIQRRCESPEAHWKWLWNAVARSAVAGLRPLQCRDRDCRVRRDLPGTHRLWHARHGRQFRPTGGAHRRGTHGLPRGKSVGRVGTRRASAANESHDGSKAPLSRATHEARHQPRDGASRRCTSARGLPSRAARSATWSSPILPTAK
jgi:hypothetical protein